MNSREVFYLLCSIPIEEIGDLATASDLFEADELKFGELIQRDIDRARVIRMADGYLKAVSDKAAAIKEGRRVEAPRFGYGIVYACSRCPENYLDLTSARGLLGYEPEEAVPPEPAQGTS